MVLGVSLHAGYDDLTRVFNVGGVDPHATLRVRNRNDDRRVGDGGLRVLLGAGLNGGGPRSPNNARRWGP